MEQWWSGESTQARARSQDSTITQHNRPEQSSVSQTGPLILFPFCVSEMTHPESHGVLHEMASPKPEHANTFSGFCLVLLTGFHILISIHCDMANIKKIYFHASQHTSTCKQHRDIRAGVLNQNDCFYHCCAASLPKSWTGAFTRS